MKIREEVESDYYQVENLIRQAFWNLYWPGTDKHYIVHRQRQSNQFIPQLSLVAEIDSRIVGQIVCNRSAVHYENGVQLQTLNLGPICVRPDTQLKGIGSALINQTIERAKKLGFKAIILLGYPRYYKRFGFVFSKYYNIKSENNKFYYGMQVLELEEGYLLKNVEGVYKMKQVVHTEEELELFDKKFVQKEKYKTLSQVCFNKARVAMWNQALELSVEEVTDRSRME